MTEDDRECYERRRGRVLDALGGDAVMILPAAPVVRVGRDLDLRYLPDADLFYLTGYPDPGAIAVLRPGHDEGPFHLFVRDRDPEAERWTGVRAGPEADREAYGADVAYPLSALEEKLSEIVGDAERVYFRLDERPDEVERRVRELMVRGRLRRARTGRGPAVLVDPGLILDGMRLVKSPREVERIRDAARITTQAFRLALAAVAPGVGEWEVEARLESAFRSAGAEGPAFATIVASGHNATVLHYIANDRVMEAGELVLIDAGARVRGYNADVTRTVPVDGSLRSHQQPLHEAVHEAHDAAIAAIRPGATIEDVNGAALRVLVQAMVDHGLLDGDPAEIVEDDERHKAFFPHRTAHWLGLDVHDVGSYAVDGEPRVLEPGMVLTVEPGLYVPAEAEDVPAALRGTGIRIEDDVLVTDEGHDVLTGALPI